MTRKCAFSGLCHEVFSFRFRCLRNFSIDCFGLSNRPVGVGFLLASLAMLAVADTKKPLALFSVAHMSFSAVVLTDCSDFSLLGNLSWHHHSLVTGFLFGLSAFLCNIRFAPTKIFSW